MPFVRSLASKRHAYVIVVTFSLSEIMPTSFYCVLKGLVYIVIVAPLSCQPFSCVKCTKLNIYLFYDIKLVFNTKYMFFMHLCTL